MYPSPHTLSPNAPYSLPYPLVACTTVDPSVVTATLLRPNQFFTGGPHPSTGQVYHSGCLPSGQSLRMVQFNEIPTPSPGVSDNFSRSASYLPPPSPFVHSLQEGYSELFPTKHLHWLSSGQRVKHLHLSSYGQRFEHPQWSSSSQRRGSRLAATLLHRATRMALMPHPN